MEEKLRLLTAKDGFTTDDLDGKLPSVTASDGPCGLRIESESFPKGEPSLCYPAPQVIANSWDGATAKSIGEAIARDCIEKGVDMLLAPGVNIKRTPLCGRNFEYFSEDPYLSGKLAAAYVAGVQSQGVGASVKHFCANNREWDRCFQSSELDERTLMELYAKPFEIVVRESMPWTVMCAYNPVNGVYASENGYILKNILREKLGFEGAIISDWGAVHDRGRALNATLDIEFPFQPTSFENLKEGLIVGKITEQQVDESVERILSLLDKKRQAQKLREKHLGQETETLTIAERRKAALNGAREGIVLLKNEGVLPLKDGERITVLGSLSESPSVTGGGSARVIPSQSPHSLRETLKELLPNSTISYCGGYVYASSILPIAMPWVSGQREAAELAYFSDIAIVVIGTNQLIETECYDRSSLRLPPELESLVLAVAEENENTVVIVEAGSAVDMTPWIEKVKAVIYTGFAGECMNEALAEILTGKICPSGKLSETFPLCLEDTPTKGERGNGFAERYAEGIFVGYRWYDEQKKEVLFPFGHGLSYTRFEYTELKVKPIDEDDLEVTFFLENIGGCRGKEAIQLYVRQRHSPVVRPPKELKGFEKIDLEKGEKRLVSFRLGRESFAVWSTVHGGWHIFGGEFEILVGASSRDIRLTARITLGGDD